MRMLLKILVCMVIALDLYSMKKEHDKNNIVGVVYWGFWALVLSIAFK